MTEPLLAFLRGTFHSTAANLRFLGAGMFSRAYRFDTEAGSFVLRVGLTREAFEKDQFASERMGRVLPVPKVLTIGRYDDTPTGGSQFYCISDWKPGRILTVLSTGETRKLLPSLFDNLLTMSRVPVSPQTGFGILNGAGRARRHYPAWAEFIGAVDDFALTFTPRGSETYRSWEKLFAETRLDEYLVRDARHRLTERLPYLPNERHYVHGDFGFDNALADGHRVTALLDWAEMRVGDWLYDLAYVSWHSEPDQTLVPVDYIGVFRRWADASGLAVPHLNERIQAYYLSIFLGNAFLEANRGMWDWYADDVARYRHFFAFH